MERCCYILAATLRHPRKPIGIWYDVGFRATCKCTTCVKGADTYTTCLHGLENKTTCLPRALLPERFTGSPAVQEREKKEG